MSCKYLWPCQDFLISTSNNKKDEHSPGNTILLTFSWTEQKGLAWVPRILIFNKTSIIDLHILWSALPCLSWEQFQEQAAHPPCFIRHISVVQRQLKATVPQGKTLPGACITRLSSRVSGCPGWFLVFDIKSMYLHFPYSKLQVVSPLLTRKLHG